MTENLPLGPILVHLVQIWAQEILFLSFISKSIQSLSQAIIQYNIKETNKPNFRKWEKKIILGLILACFGPNLGRKIIFREFYLYQTLYIFASYHCMWFQEKLMNQTRENGKKPSFRSDFDRFGPDLSSKNFFSDFISTRYQKLLQVIIVCNLKEN